MSEIMQLDDTYIAHTYARFPVRLVEFLNRHQVNTIWEAASP